MTTETAPLPELKPEELNPKKYSTDSIIKSNLITLCARLNKVQKLFGKRFVVTSGLRSQEQQQNLIKAGVSKATKSKHLQGCAADIADAEGELKKFLLDNPKILIECDLWCESAEHTPTWCHFQIVPPGSGNRWFIP